MPKYFTLEELLRSSVAERKGISNIPSWEVIGNLERLAAFLDEMREAWGSGIRVTSGFRCPQLNSAVGGVQGSAHLTGNAVDLVPVNGKLGDFEAFLKKWLKGRKFDQCIYETSKTSGSRWVHFGLFNNKGEQRCRLFGLSAA